MISILVLKSMLILSVAMNSFNYNEKGMDWPGIYPSCLGFSQSPIALNTKTAKKVKNLAFDFELNNEETQAEINIKNSIKIKGVFSMLTIIAPNGRLVEYLGKNVHIHSPSEHTLDGKNFDAEIHFFHKLKPKFSGSGANKYAEVAFFLQVSEGAKDDFLEAISVKTGDKVKKINAYKLLTKSLLKTKKFITYEGSKTVPPCSENVRWFIFTKPISIGADQLKDIQNNFVNNQNFAKGNGNNRSIQPIYDRELVYVSGKSLTKYALKTQQA